MAKQFEVRCPVQVRTFDAFCVPVEEPLRSWQLGCVLDEVYSGIAVPGVITEEQGRRAVEAWTAYTAAQAKSRRYAGTASNLTEEGGRSHWGARYPGGNTVRAWVPYLDSVDEWDETRREVFGPVFGSDPLDIMVGVIESAYDGGTVSRARHPRHGRRMNAGLYRGGVPAPHLDNGAWDVPMESNAHIGVVLVANSSSGSRQRVHRYMMSAPMESGPNAGNYDFKVPAGTEYIDLPSETGYINIIAARFVHEVLADEDRLTFAIHVVRKPNGDLIYYA